MTDRDAIIREFEAIEALAKKSLRGPVHDEIADTVAVKLGVPRHEVVAVMLDHWTECMGAG